MEWGRGREVEGMVNVHLTMIRGRKILDKGVMSSGLAATVVSSTVPTDCY